MTYQIVELYDEHDCETCGPSWAEGFRIFKNGELIIDKPPYAHCFSSESHGGLTEALWEILELEGINVEIYPGDS